MYVGISEFPNTPSTDRWPRCSWQESWTLFCMQIKMARSLCLCAVVILGWHVAEVLLPRVVPNAENLLRFLTQQPKIPHIHGARSLPLDCVIDNAHRCRVVDVDGCGRLRVPHFFQCETDNSGFHGVEEECPQFGFGCRGSHTLEDCTLGQNGAIEADWATVLGD